MIKTIGETSQVMKNAQAQNWADSFQLQMKGTNDSLSEMGEFNDSKSFGAFLTDSLAKVNGLQQEANAAIEKLAAGETAELHETLLTVEKAEIAFKAMNQIRQKVLDAYREVMKMQI